MRALLATLALLLPAAGWAQSAYPDKPIKILVGFTPGVAPDIVARVLAEKFTEAWGKPAVVENITGAGGNIATERGARAAPDGYTLLMGGNGSLVFGPGLYQKLPFDPVKDFAPITQIFVAANVFAVTSLKRSGIAPELPTMAESGYAGFEAVPWFGLMAPAGTPAPILDKLYRETVRVLALPEVRRKLEELGLDVIGNTPGEFAAVIRAEIPRWAKVIKDAGIKAPD